MQPALDVSPRITHIGGPTVLIEIGTVRLLSDPTFDPAGGRYSSGPVELRKTAGPAIAADALGAIDAVLLSHDQHADNLDLAGRALLPQAGQVLTTPDGALRLGGNAVAVATWQTVTVTGADGQEVRVTATPARHGPEGIEAVVGEVAGWIVEWEGQGDGVLYISGDTVLYEGFKAIASRYRIAVALLHCGAARVEARGPANLTLPGSEAAQFVADSGIATAIPIHYEGWAHFSEGREAIEQAFAALGLQDRLRWLPLGQPVIVGGRSE